MSIRLKLSLIFALSIFIVLFGVTEYRVQQLHELVVADPLFYTPHIDTQELQGSIASLLEAEHALNETMRTNYRKGQLQNGNGVSNTFEDVRLFPREYLHLLPEAIQTTQTFIDAPTFRNAFLMSRTVAKTAEAYAREAQLFTDLALYSFEETGEAPLVVRFLGSEVAKEQILADISLIKKNGKELVREAHMRYRCLFGLPCPDERTYIPVYVPLPPDELTDRLVLPKNILSLGYEEGSFSKPYVIESSCFPDRYNLMYLLEEPNRVPIKLAHESYYIDHKYYTDRVSSDSYHWLFINNGMRYDHQAEWTDYLCADLRYWGDITTIDYLNTKLGLTDIISSYDLYTFYQTLREEDGDPRLLRLIENKIVYLPNLLQGVTRHLSIFKTILAFGGNNTPPRHLIAQRSNHSFLYGTFSRSIWRLNERLDYVVRPNLSPAPSYTTYSQLQEEYSDEEIASFHQDRWDLLEQ